ncbi:MAG: NUDIX domain-containing protein, partial [Gammaproteobacteria bacterium]
QRPRYPLPLFRHCPRCAAPAGDGDNGRRFVCPACDFRYYHNVAAAVAAVIVHDGAVLVTRRAHAPAAGTLDLPGGFIEPGEAPAAALARELAEELGWAQLPAAPTFFHAVPNDYDYAGVRYATCDLFYSLAPASRPPVVAADDVAAAHWHALDALDTDAFGMASVRHVLGLLDGAREA